MRSLELRKKFLDFFQEKGHKIIPSASLIPENDPTVLFTTAGMHPLVPFLLGEKHPSGKKLANVQVCIRTGDIDEVGDENHHTFFEMLGNWSLGDYFKSEAIKYSFEFLTDKKWLGIKKEKLAISFFAGDNDAPIDEETKKIWLALGISEEKIKALPKKDNWWGPAGQTGPCGPDTEMFYWTGLEAAPKEFDPEDKRWFEIWNDVFMQYFKNIDGVYEPLSQKNVDTGMGLERTLAVLNGLSDDYQTDVFLPIIEKIEELSGKKYQDYKKEFRIIADHVKAAVFIIREGILPGKNGREYVLRRLIRRAILQQKLIKLNILNLNEIVPTIIEIYKDAYPDLAKNQEHIMEVFRDEEGKFIKTIHEGDRKLTDLFIKARDKKMPITGMDIFDIYSTDGYPIELSIETLDISNKDNILGKDLYNKENIFIEFNIESKRHQELSRTASAGMFKGGLADSGEKAVRYHTATHLLLAALRQVLGEHVYQRGSNINAERLRFDFSHPDKMTEEQLKKVEEIVNQKIKENIPVVCQEMSLEEAKKKKIMGIFEDKYGDKVKTYSMAEFSKEICGGPHANNTSELGEFKITKEESSAAGVRRIKATLK
jgi:alanyl-tRNA synthetase